MSVKVFLDANGAVLSALVLHSFGFPNVDLQALAAARASTYAPKVINCRAVPGTYVFTWGVLHERSSHGLRLEAFRTTKRRGR